MSTIAKKITNSFRHGGLRLTLAKIMNYPFNVLTRKRFANKVLTLSSIEDRFTYIYNKNHWACDESVSGTGSTLIYTKNLRQELPKLIEQFAIKSIFDAPCGDFNWMRLLLPLIDVDYIGGDIVQPLIDEHNKIHKNKKTRFVHIDLTQSRFPKSDLMICRDCLFHLSYDDTRAVLRNFVDSDIPYFLATTHMQASEFINKNIRTGDWRLIDLFSSPYNFPRDTLASIDDWVAPDAERKMCLWSKLQVSIALATFT